MSEPLRPAPISEHFRLIRDCDAYGHTLHTDHRSVNSVHLLQPYNDWAAKHYDQSRDEQHLLFMLEYAYAKGYAAAQAQIRKDLGLL